MGGRNIYSVGCIVGRRGMGGDVKMRGTVRWTKMDCRLEWEVEKEGSGVMRVFDGKTYLVAGVRMHQTLLAMMKEKDEEQEEEEIQRVTYEKDKGRNGMKKVYMGR